MVKRPGFWLWVAVAAVTGLRLVFGAWAELIPEEAYYWTYSQYPAFGYFDHPPMVAWTVWLGTAVFGNTELGVRFVNILLWVLTCGLLVQTTKRWFDERVAVGAGLLFMGLPIFVGIGTMVTPDGPLLFFWMLCLYAVTRGLQEEKLRYWWLAGVALGGALLSKYYAIMLVPSLFWFLWFAPKYRPWLRRGPLWLALGVGALVFSPVIWWNSQHQWASFAFQSARTVAQKGSSAGHVATFWLAQIGVLLPLGFALLAVTGWQAVRRGWRERDVAWNFVGSFGLPVFGLFVAASFKTEVHVNWTAPAFLALLPGAAALGLAGWDTGKRGWRWGAWLLGVMSVIGIVALHVGISGFGGQVGYTHAGGWRELATSVDAVARRVESQTGQRPFVIGADKYNLAAELGFYLQRPNDCLNTYAFGRPGLGYRYWSDLRQFEGRPAIVVGFKLNTNMVAMIRHHFTRMDESAVLPVATAGPRWQHVHAIIGYGYQAVATTPADASLD